MTNEKIKELLTKLWQKTIKKELEWKKENNSEYSLSYPKSSISIRQYSQTEGMFLHQLSVYNLRGECIIKLDDNDCADIVDESINAKLELENSVDFLEYLFGKISSNYYKTEETIEDLLSNLDDDGTF